MLMRPNLELVSDYFRENLRHSSPEKSNLTCDNNPHRNKENKARNNTLSRSRT